MNFLIDCNKQHVTVFSHPPNLQYSSLYFLFCPFNICNGNKQAVVAKWSKLPKSSRDRRLGPRFESPLGFTKFIIKNWTLTPIADTLRRSAAQGKKWWRLQAPRLSEAVSLS